MGYTVGRSNGGRTGALGAGGRAGGFSGGVGVMGNIGTVGNLLLLEEEAREWRRQGHSVGATVERRLGRTQGV